MNTDERGKRDLLLVQAKAGDVSSLGLLLECHRDYLMQSLSGEIGAHLRGKLDPADIVQDAFLNAHRDFHSFTGTSCEEFFSWLRQLLATRLAGATRHYLGTQKRDPRLECPLPTGLNSSSDLARTSALISDLSTPSKQVARDEATARLEEALAKLPPHYREVIILHNLESIPLAEVAIRLGRTQDSVQKIWVRALIHLRKIL